MNIPGIRSLRARILVLVIGAVLVPLAATGVWWSRSAGGASESLVTRELDDALDHVTRVAVDQGELSGQMLTEMRDDPAVADVELIRVFTPAMGPSMGEGSLSTTFDSLLRVRTGLVQVDGRTWIVRRRVVPALGITIAAAGRRDRYAAAFQGAAMTGSFALLGVATASLLLALVFSRRISRSLVDLANATDAVAAGDLDRRVVTHSNDEVNRVGRAFNTMTESLRATLKQLSQREALVAVGEFAAMLAHEVRNPLTSIRIDLQRVEERLPDGSELRAPLARALREVQRLDGTVSGALRIARSGNVALEPVDLRTPIGRAVEVAAPAFARAGAAETRVECGPEAMMVRGDEAALEQVFLNLLLNAAQALAPGGSAGISMRSDGRFVVAEFWDTGIGIAPDRLASVFDPFYSTRPDGTGLGLAVARQVVLAHGGTITIDSAEDAGTTVSITLPAG